MQSTTASFFAIDGQLFVLKYSGQKRTKILRTSREQIITMVAGVLRVKDAFLFCLLPCHKSQEGASSSERPERFVKRVAKRIRTWFMLPGFFLGDIFFILLYFFTGLCVL